MTPMRRIRRTTLRFTDAETSIIKLFADEQGTTTSEAMRRLLFWKRLPDFELPEPNLPKDSTQ